MWPVTDNTVRIDELAVNAGIVSITGPNSEVYYDYVGSSKAFTSGTIDRTKAYCETVSQGVNTVSVTSMIDNTFSDFLVLHVLWYFYHCWFILRRRKGEFFFKHNKHILHCNNKNYRVNFERFFPALLRN